MTAARAAEAAPAAPAAKRPVAVEVRDLAKTFRIPHRQVSTLKERVLHPFARAEHEELAVLRGVSFDVGAGEFFGIVGRNGSGKSTLLKCLAGIYRADRGRIRAAGRLAPFIELGVGFNPDLTARDNVLINAVMMGLSPRQARARFDEIIAFAELEGFLDLKLKNYSSGMQVRLAFSTMVHTEADVLLIDEVLAVGDAAFQQKCFDVFDDLRARGRTLVLVTHDMAAVERFCHRAMLLADGRIELIGAPDEVARAYLQRNFGAAVQAPAPEPAEADEPEEPDDALHAARATLLDVWVEDDDGRRVEAVAHGAPFSVHLHWETQVHVDRARFDVWIDSANPIWVFGADARARVFAASTMGWADPPRALRAGERVHVRLRVVDAFADGRFHIGASLLAGRQGEDVLALDEQAGSFVSYGGGHVYGLAEIDHELTVERGG
jgi:ABC-type polysaccharide/polyol phosphate transport system ATPase subunit